MDAALSLSPERVSSLQLLSALLEKQGKTSETREINERILRVDPDNAMAANNLAVLYAERPETLAEALRLARVAAARAPANPLVLDTLGWVQYRSGRYEEARGNLEEARRLLPTHPEIAFHLGAVYARLGQKELARPLLVEALEKGSRAPWVEEAKSLADGLGGPAR
jgi:Flp pilus assembly protein TadD